MKLKKVIREATIKVSHTTKNKVAKAVVGTEHTIGSFYDEAAEQKLKPIKKQ